MTTDNQKGKPSEVRISKHGFLTTAQRSETMRRIKGKDTVPEMRLRRSLWAKGMRYRKNVAALPGKPDVVFIGQKVAIFVDGDFWHGHKWPERKRRLLANLQDEHRKQYWIQKIERNMERDEKNNHLLAEQGFTVLRFWDHDIKKNLARCVNEVRDSLNQT